MENKELLLSLLGRDGGMTPVVEREALSSNPILPKKKKAKCQKSQR
jgi:hypothetical protein